MSFWSSLKNFFKSVIKEVQRAPARFFGKTFVFLGPRMSGKTVWSTFISEEKFHTDYVPGIVGESRGPNRLSISEGLKFNVKKCKDAPGLEKTSFRLTWRGFLKNGDYCLYLFDASKVLSGEDDYLELIAAHRDFLKKNLKGMPLILVATHLDIIKKKTAKNGSIRMLSDKIYSHSSIQEFSADLGVQVKLAGSLGTKTEMLKLTELLIKGISSLA